MQGNGEGYCFSFPLTCICTSPRAFLSCTSFYDVIYASSYTLCNAVYVFIFSQSINGIRLGTYFYLEADTQQHKGNYTKLLELTEMQKCSFFYGMMDTNICWQNIWDPWISLVLLFSNILHYFLLYQSNIQQLVPQQVIQRIYPIRKKDASHYNDVIMGAIASQITSLTVVYSTVYSDADERKHQSSASLAFVCGIHRWPVNSPHKWPVTRKMVPFDDVIMKELVIAGAGLDAEETGLHSSSDFGSN